MPQLVGIVDQNKQIAVWNYLKYSPNWLLMLIFCAGTVFHQNVAKYGNYLVTFGEFSGTQLTIESETLKYNLFVQGVHKSFSKFKTF